MENILQKTGPCGKFQVLNSILIQLCRLVSSWAVGLMVFGLYNPGWRCAQRNKTQPAPLTTVVNLMRSPPLLVNESTFLAPNNPGGNQSIVAGNQDSYNETCDVIDLCGEVEFSPASATIVTEFGLLCDRVWIAYTIVSVISGGMLMGALLWGQVGERFGRKPSIYLSMVTMMVAIGLAVFSPSWQVYALFSFVVGLGYGSLTTTGHVLLTEFLNATWRARVASIPILNFGTMSFALVTFVLRDWRHVHLATAGVMALACLGYFWVPESLRWLVIHGKTAQTQKVVRKIATVNKKPITEEWLEQVVNANASADEDKERYYTYLDLFRTREIRFLTVMLALIRFVSLFGYEMIGFAIQSLPGDFYTNIVLASLVDLCSAFFMGPLVNGVGRRYTGLFFTALGVLSSSVLLICLLTMGDDHHHHHQARDILVTSMALVNKCAMYGSVGIHSLVVIELMPTALRTVSFGFCNTMARAMSIAGPFLLPRDLPSTVAFFAVLLVSQTAAALAYFSLPETKDKPMRENIRYARARHDGN